MPYDVMTVTTKGSQLFAQLAGDPNEHLVIEGCDADASVKDQTQALAVENRPPSPISTTNHIVLSGVTDHSFLVYAQFIAGQTTEGQVNSFYLYGYLESAPNDKYVIAVASDSRQSKLPSTQDIINYVEIRFSLTFTPIQSTSQVGVPSDNDYVLRSEFLQNINQISTQINNISDRVVTTHIEGQTTVGEDQTIYGVKNFENSTSFKGSYYIHPTILNSGDVTQKRFRINSLENATSNVLTPEIYLISQVESGNVTQTTSFIGNTDHRVNNIYGLEITHSNSRGNSIDLYISSTQSHSIHLDDSTIILTSPEVKIDSPIYINSNDDRYNKAILKKTENSVKLYFYDVDLNKYYTSCTLSHSVSGMDDFIQSELRSEVTENSTNYSSVKVSTIKHDEGVIVRNSQESTLYSKYGSKEAKITVSAYEETNSSTQTDITESYINIKSEYFTIESDSTTFNNNIKVEGSITTNIIQAISATDHVLIASRGTSNPCAVSVGWQTSLSRNSVIIGGTSYGWVFDNQYLKPLVASTSQIGTPTEMVNTIYVGALGDSNNRTNTVYTTVTNTSVLMTNSITSADSTITLEKSILPYTDESYNLGQPQHKFNEIHAKTLFGILPTSTSTSYNKGTILLITFNKNSFSEYTLGKTITASTSSPIYVAKYFANISGFGNGSNVIVGTRFCLLSEFDISSSGTTDSVVVLAMVI